MNRFEQAVYDCMIPTAELLEETTKPLHRAILLNFWRHVHLEGAGEYEKIVAPDGRSVRTSVATELPSGRCSGACACTAGMEQARTATIESART